MRTGSPLTYDSLKRPGPRAPSRSSVARCSSTPRNVGSTRLHKRFWQRTLPAAADARPPSRGGGRPRDLRVRSAQGARRPLMAISRRAAGWITAPVSGAFARPQAQLACASDPCCAAHSTPTSRRISSIAPAAGEQVPARQRRRQHVAHERAALEAADHDVVAHGDQREVRDQAHAHARGDEPLDRVVVVGLEGDARLEARGLAGALEHGAVGAVARRAEDPVLLGEVSRGGCAASWPRDGRPTRTGTSGRRAAGGASIAGSAIGANPASTVSAMSHSPAFRPVQALRRARAARASPRRPGGARGIARSPAARSSPPPSGRRPVAAVRRACRRSPRARPRRRRAGRGSTSAWATSAPAGLGQVHAARAALDEHGARLALQCGDLLGDRRLRVGERLGRGGERAAHRDLAEDPQPLHIEH